jgi:hypothetical protein
MNTEQFQVRGNNSVCAGAFQLLRSRAPAHLRGSIDNNKQQGQLEPSRNQSVNI